MLVCLATLFVTGDAELTKSRSDVIQLKCSGKPWYELCTEMLKNTPDTAGVTVYALQTATMVKRKYEDTAIAGRHSLQPLSADSVQVLPGPVRHRMGTHQRRDRRHEGL
jgi:hypothetical protein